MFERLDFSASAGKSIGSMVTGAASGLTSAVGNFVSNLSGSGLGIGSLKSLAANKLDSATKFLNGDPSFSRISGQDLFLNRSGELTDINSIIGISRDGQSAKSIKYPLDLGNDFIQIEFASYDRPAPLKKANFATQYVVNLPLPKDLTETHSVRLDPQETGLLTAIESNLRAAGQAFDGQGTTEQYANQAIGFMAQAAGPIAGAVAQATGASRIMSAAGIGTEQILNRAGQMAGMVPNPHISVFFNGVDIRPAMEFSWLFSARNPQESQAIKTIIKEFKKRSLPTVTKGDENLMAYPQMVRLTLFPWKETNSQDWSGTMPIYKRGFIQSINVNYSPNGLSFFNDKQSSPVFVVFSFTFQEIEVWTGSDYGNEDRPNPAADIANTAKNFGDAVLTKAKSLLPGGE